MLTHEVCGKEIRFDVGCHRQFKSILRMLGDAECLLFREADFGGYLRGLALIS